MNKIYLIVTPDGRSTGFLDQNAAETALKQEREAWKTRQREAKKNLDYWKQAVVQEVEIPFEVTVSDAEEQ